MKAPSHDRLFLYRFIVCFAVFVNFLAVSKAHADLPPPTPPAAIHTIANTPHQMPLSAGVTPDGRFTYSTGSPRPNTAQYESARRALHGTNPDLLSGMKSHPIRLTNNYGQVATGQIRTATTMPSNGALAQGLGALVVADMANAHLNNLNAQGTADRFVRGLEQGNIGEVLTAVAQLADITGLGGNIYRTMTQNDIAPIRQQMQQQAEQAYYQYQSTPRADPAAYADYRLVTIREWGADCGCDNDTARTRQILISKADWQQLHTNNGLLVQATNDDFSWPLRIGSVEINPALPIGYIGHRNFINVSIAPATQTDIQNHNARNTPQLADLIPSEAQMTQIMLQLLNDTNRNHTELINALVAGGKLDPSKQPTQVLGSPAENTFITPPFTPAGSDTAQQTQFIVNKDGSVTVSQIQRPDLAAHTSQAPTRAEVGQQAPSPAETRDAKQGSTAEKPDICAQNPNSLMCADLGSGDYTDPVIPTHVVPMDFKPADIFDTNGVCPQPIGFEVMGKTFQMSYQPVCDFSSSIRPFVVLGGMILAMTLCYAAVRNM